MSDHESQDGRPTKRARIEDATEISAATAPEAPAVSNGEQTVPTPSNGPVDDSETAKEIRSGITVYANPDTPGFNGILKMRYTDFLVNEIMPNGEVCHLKTLGTGKEGRTQESKKQDEAPVPPATEQIVDATGESQSRKDEKTSEAADQKETIAGQAPPISEADTAEVKAIFGEKVASQIFKLFEAVYKHPERKARDFFALYSEVFQDKDDRTKAHQAVRRIFLGKLSTETEQDETITIKAMPPDVRNQRGGGREQRGGRNQPKGKLGWSELGGEHLHFTLYKANKDTMEVVYYLGSRIKVDAKNFKWAGNKDKRAVTVQRISVKRVRAEALGGLQKGLRNSAIGDFEYRPNSLELGDLLGNEFVITLRDCHFKGGDGLDYPKRFELAQKTVSTAVENFRKTGFINYFGLQRFGTFAATTDTIGLKMLQGDLAGAVDLILEYTPTALSAAQDENSTVLISQDDKNRALGLHKWKTTQNAQEALAIIPRRFAAERCIIQHLGRKNKTGELRSINDYQGALMMIPRNLRDMYLHAYQSLVFNVMAGKRWELYGNRVVEGDLVLVNEHKDKEVQEPEEEVDEAGEVIIKPPSADATGGGNRRGNFERARPLTKQEAESGQYSVYDVVLTQPGFDVEYPQNEIGKYYEEFMKSERGGGLDPYKMERKWSSISMPGAYRKLMTKAMKVEGDVREYVSDEEQMVETDLEKLEREAKEQSNGEKQDVEMESMKEQEGEKKIAVVLKLQLPTSCFATMALRELMKENGVRLYKPEFSEGR